MISIQNTENLTGVSISGDYNDLYQLMEAFHIITIDEFSTKHLQYLEISTRVLGVCYDVRHSMQGDREVELVENGMNEDKMKWHSIITPVSNVYYSDNHFYPEMFLVTLVLNALVKLRIRELSKSKYYLDGAFDRRAVWDQPIATIRLFQSEFAKCVQKVLTKASYTRWLKYMNDDYINIENIACQYVDLLNVRYINMDREKRQKKLSAIAKRIAEFESNPEHNEIRAEVLAAAKRYGCSKDNIRLSDVEYPDEIIW